MRSRRAPHGDARSPPRAGAIGHQVVLTTVNAALQRAPTGASRAAPHGAGRTRSAWRTSFVAGGQGFLVRLWCASRAKRGPRLHSRPLCRRCLGAGPARFLRRDAGIDPELRPGQPAHDHAPEAHRPRPVNEMASCRKPSAASARTTSVFFGVADCSDLLYHSGERRPARCRHGAGLGLFADCARDRSTTSARAGGAHHLYRRSGRRASRRDRRSRPGTRTALETGRRERRPTSRRRPPAATCLSAERNGRPAAERLARVSPLPDCRRPWSQIGGRRGRNFAPERNAADVNARRLDRPY